MRITLEYSVGSDHDPSLLRASGVAAVARAADRLGYDAIAFTEHPAPSVKWLAGGGHGTFDLVSALAYCAGITERIRLMTHLLVVPYHNPFAMAKALTTVDLLSEGRLTVVAGTGYLRSEFLALGIDPDERNARFDESLTIMRALWAAGAEGVDHQGDYFSGIGVAHVPSPVQTGGPPILIGGNSPLSRRRAARHQGWSPLVVSESVARTVRTPVLTLEALGRRIQEVRRATAEQQGPDTVAAIQVQTPHTGLMRGGISRAEHSEHLAHLTEIGVDSIVLQIARTSVDDAIRALEEYAASYR